MNINTEEYWNIEWNRRPERIYPYYQKIVELCKGKKVLDFGCGRGDLMKFIPDSYGMDISSVGIGIIKDRGMEGEIGIEPKGKYDVVVSTEVLEHLDDDKEMIEKFFECAATVIVAVPNDCLPPEVEKEHQRTYTVESFRELFGDRKTRIWVVGDYMFAISGEFELPISVLVAIPNTGWIRNEVGYTMIKLVNDRRYEVKITTPVDKPIDQNRNVISKKFIDEGWDYLLMIDSDNPPQKNPLDLVEKDLDIVGLPTLQVKTDEKNGMYWVVMREVEEGYQGHLSNQQGIQEVDAVGTGCILIARRVLEKVKAPFMRDWDENGIAQLGQDFMFCKKAKEKGFKVWSAWDYPCWHFKEVNLNLWQH